MDSDRRGAIQETAWRDLSKCINQKEGKLRLEELHSQVCEVVEKISIYRRMQCIGYYWPNINKDVATIQEECQKVSTFSGQRKKLCCVRNRRLEDPIHGILSLRDPAN